MEGRGVLHEHDRKKEGVGGEQEWSLDNIFINVLSIFMQTSTYKLQVENVSKAPSVEVGGKLRYASLVIPKQHVENDFEVCRMVKLRKGDIVLPWLSYVNGERSPSQFPASVRVGTERVDNQYSNWVNIGGLKQLLGDEAYVVKGDGDETVILTFDEGVNLTKDFRLYLAYIAAES